MRRILVINEKEPIRLGLKTAIESEATRNFLGITYKIEVYTAKNGSEGIAIFKQKTPDVVITDIKMKDMSGANLLKEILSIDKKAIVIMLADLPIYSEAIEYIKLGAYNYVAKPWKITDIRKELKKIFSIQQNSEQKSKLLENNTISNNEIKNHFQLGDFIGSSKGIIDIVSIIEKVSTTDLPVLIIGEQGTEKEIIAKCIHKLSPRKNNPFIKINCWTSTENSLEREMFGYEEVVFDGTTKHRLGRYEIANDGTIFLEDIEEMPIKTQAKLLRVIEENELERVGVEKTIKVNARIIASTSKDLRKEIQEKRFSNDLYYKLNIVQIYVPPLRERKEDIPDIARHFIKRHKDRLISDVTDISDEAIQFLQRYYWPGNTRELENVIEQSILLASGKIIEQENLPPYIKRIYNPDNDIILSANDFPKNMNLNQYIAEIETRIIKEALKLSGNDKSKTAKLLGIKISALNYKISKLRLNEDLSKEKE